MSASVLQSYFAAVESVAGCRWHGRVRQVVGNLIESEGPVASLGDCCEVVNSAGEVFEGEVVGFRDNTVLTMTQWRLLRARAVHLPLGTLGSATSLPSRPNR